MRRQDQSVHLLYASVVLNKDGSIRVAAESRESIEKIAEICAPCDNVFVERHKFNT